MTAPVALTDDDISAALAAYTHEVQEDFNDSARATAAPYRFVRPLIHAADSLIEYLQNTEGRFMTGLREIDLMTRGIGAGELMYVTGYTHSGKTQAFLTAVVNNAHRRIVLITADETSEQVLTKIVCMLTGSNAERLEERVKAGDQQAIDRVRRIAREDLRNLIIVDGGMHLDNVSTVIAEAEDHWQAPVEALGIDYLDLLRTGDTDVEGKSQTLKGWVVEQSFPTIVIHQGSRGNSGGGKRLAMNSMKYGGEAEATFVLGVRRLRDDPELTEGERRSVENTVEISLIKNKRPPSKIGEFTYGLRPESGLIVPIEEI